MEALYFVLIVEGPVTVTATECRCLDYGGMKAITEGIANALRYCECYSLYDSEDGYNVDS